MEALELYRETQSGAWYRHIGFLAIPKNASSSLMGLFPHNNRSYKYALPDGLKLFCVLRDPVQRFESAFNFLAKNAELDPDQLNSIVCDEAKLEALIMKNNFCRYHLMPQVYFTGLAPAIFERNFHISQMTKLQHWLEEELEWKRTVPSKPIPQRNKGKYTSQLTKKSKRILEKLYAKDYQFIAKAGH